MVGIRKIGSLHTFLFEFTNRTVLRNITQTKVLIGQQLGDPTVIIKPTFPESFVDLGYGYGHILGIYKGEMVTISQQIDIDIVDDL